MDNEKLEFWLRGPLLNITPLLQPVAHALLQARSEITALMKNFPEDLLWEMPAETASPAFHLQHIAGVLDRLFTYAANHQLNTEQLNYLSAEGKRNDLTTVHSLIDKLNQQIDWSINSLQNTNPETLTETRYVGRNKISSTKIGLLFHAAEHTMRHTGQLLVTVRVILNNTNLQLMHRS